jgi:hypothetical protein
MAKTTTATANKNRQKQSFMISPPSSLKLTNFIEKYDPIARLRYDSVQGYGLAEGKLVANPGSHGSCWEEPSVSTILSTTLGREPVTSSYLATYIRGATAF